MSDENWPSDIPMVTGDEAVASIVFSIHADHLTWMIGKETGDELLNIDGQPAIRRINGQLLKFQWKRMMPSLSIATYELSMDGGKTWHLANWDHTHHLIQSQTRRQKPDGSSVRTS